MKIVKIFPYPHVEMRISVSEQMEADLKDCYKKADSGGRKDCDACTWNKIGVEKDVYGTSLCGNAELAGKVLGTD